MSNQPVVNTLARQFYDKAGDTISYLAGRWEDEKEYEDIKEYQAALQKIAPQGVIITKMSKRPFGCTFNSEGKIYKMSITLKGCYSYQQIG